MFSLIKLRLNVRYYSTKVITKDVKKYTDTINLPKTKFPNRLSTARLEKIEKQILNEKFALAYKYQEENNSEPAFVLHDGPPYANGDLHMGHAINKVLKDITLRHHVVRGKKVSYSVGWDCHGLPIELKAINEAKNTKKNQLKLRQKCRQFAMDAINKQKEEFRSLGILTDWENENTYTTLQPNFIANQLLLFYDLYKRNLVYRDLKPVHWSPSSRTALAEAELEYDSNFRSPSVYIRFRLNKLPSGSSEVTQKVFALVWTTTPWTLPSNQAICYNPELEYALVKLIDVPSENDLYLISVPVISDFENTTDLKCEIVQKFVGNDLSVCTYIHPIFEYQNDLPFFAAVHIKNTKGTGLVHTAPAHGQEDFLVSLSEKFPVINYVDEKGHYTDDAPDFLRGREVLQEGNKLVLETIASDVVFKTDIVHSYPIDWRTKKPVIIRASEQWFINTEILKSKAINEINQIEIYPRAHAESSKKTLKAQIAKRPYWCISRQRSWGVPIPVFYNKNTGEVIVNEKLIGHLCYLLHKEGNIDFWWSKPISELIPQSVLKELQCTSEDLEKGDDIFDIWFDSGSTWLSVLKGNKIADLYLEGYDQLTGWFQSSLLMSIAARNIAPYKALFVHGFTVDEKGYKMSKSLGNIVSPTDVCKKHGTDTLRWWVAAHGTQHVSIAVNQQMMQQAVQSIEKIRSILRYLNGVIKTKQDNNLIDHESLSFLNQYLLSCLLSFDFDIENLYIDYEYNRVVAAIQKFVANQISAEYLHLIKDRLYCGNVTDLDNIRYTFLQCYKILCKALWPITPFLVEESWSYYDRYEGFHMQKIKASQSWENTKVEEVFKNALAIKRKINQQAGDINTWNLAVQIHASSTQQQEWMKHLQNVFDAPVKDSELCEVLQVGSVDLKSTILSQEMIKIDLLNLPLCLRCRRYTVDENTDICDRCSQVLKLK